ncbi:MAG: DUF2752 domain-containing protein [Flavobacterium sp.]
MEDYMLPCMHKKFFGVDCLGCGIQRSFMMLLQGDFIGAFKMYPALFTLILFFVFIGLQLVFKKRNFHKAIVSTGIITALIMVLSYSIKYF